MLKQGVWFIFFLLLGSACLDEPDCYGLNNNIIGISFKKMFDSKADTVFFKSVKADGTETTFFSNVLGTGFSQLPLDYFQNETIFHFDGIDKVYDLHLGYSAKAQFVSKECGARFFLTGLEKINSNFDSVRIISTIPKRKNASGVNLEIYRCPYVKHVKFKFSSAVTIGSITTDYPASILISSAAATSILIPLNDASSTSKILFHFTDGTEKEIEIGYIRQERTLFKVCGPQVVLSGFQIISKTFSSATIVTNTKLDPETNFEITL